MRTLILHSKFPVFFGHLGSKFQRCVLFCFIPSPRSSCTHFWVQSGEQSSHFSGMCEIHFLLQCWKLVPPRKRLIGPSVSQLPDNPCSSVSCNVTSLPSVRCHSNEKWKKQYSATAEGNLRKKILKQKSVLKTPAITLSSVARAAEIAVLTVV